MSNDPIRAALERLIKLDSASITMRSKSGSLAWTDAIDAARAALAASPTTDEPAVPEGREPAAVSPDSGTAAMRHLVERPMDERGYVDLRQFAAPAPVEGGMGELLQGLEQATKGAAAMGHGLDSWAIARAATLLEQQATELAALRTRAALVPVPVGERLPGEGDCDAQGRCWWFGPINGEDISHSYWALINGKCDNDTHWLPHWAMSHPCQPPQGGEVEG